MSNHKAPWPKKVREIETNHFDSTVWNDFKFREDDIIIASYAKSGTTWLQQIIGQLLFDGQADLPVGELSPWIDLRVPPKEIKMPMVEAQEHRRFLKTHLPVDALVFAPQAKYVLIARDGRDVVWSFYNHHCTANAMWYELLNDTPGLVGPRMRPPVDDVVEYFREWLQFDGYPIWSMWDHLSSWWAIRELPNVMLLHYNDLKEDLPGSIRHIAAFLEIPVHEENWDAIVTHCSFDFMKAHATKVSPLGGAPWEGGGDSFIHKGYNGRWRNQLPRADVERYEQMAEEKLGPECANWLAHGMLQNA